MRYDEFKYIDVAFGGVQNRNRLIEITELKAFAVDWKKINETYKDRYKTYFRYPHEMLEHFNKTKTVKGYIGACYSDYLPLDIDSNDLSKSHQITKDLLTFFQSEYDLDLNTLRIFFSGSKGFHVELPSQLFGFEPSQDLHQIFKETALKLIPNRTTIDTGIYDKSRLWRISNTINSKSGLYKIPLSSDEVFNLSVEEIQKLAMHQRKGTFYDTNVSLNPILHKLYLQAKETMRSERHTSNSNEKKYKAIFQRELEDGERNNTLTSYCGRLKAGKIPQGEAETILKALNQNHCSPPLDDEDVIGITKSIYSYPNQNEVKLTRLVELPYPGRREWLIEGILPKNYPSIFYGDGGLGKSFLALFLQILASMGGQDFLGCRFPQARVTCLYLDWELEKEEIRRRAEQMALGLEILKLPDGLLYYSPSVSLFKFLKELPRIIETEGIGFLITDSLGAACVDPDRVIDVIEVMTALKNLGTTSLAIDHQSKMQTGDSYDLKLPFGSVYKQNLCRSMFQLSRVNDSNNPLCLQLKHGKSNFSARSDDLRFEVHFEGDRVLFTESNEPSKDEKDMRLIHEGICEMIEKETETIQKNIISHLKYVISKERVLKLLEKGTGKFWDMKPREGRGGGKVYVPKEVFWNSDTIYNQKTRKVQNEDFDIPEVIAP